MTTRRMIVMKKKIALLLVVLIALSSVTALADYGAILKKDARIYADAKMKTRSARFQSTSP